MVVTGIGWVELATGGRHGDRVVELATGGRHGDRVVELATGDRHGDREGKVRFQLL